jgi:glycosyltransferase involved in cell wall biosynthesis
MRVLIVMPLAEQRGGAEVALRQLIHEGRDQGVEWSVVFLEDGPMVQEFRDVVIATSVVPGGRLRQVSRYLRAVARIRSIARLQRADLIFSWMTKAHLYGGVAALTARVPCIWYQHGIPGSSWMDRLATLLPARGVIATSEAAAAAQDRLRPVRRRRVVHPGIDLGRFDPGRLLAREVVREELGLPAGVPLVGFFGRLQRWKGVGVLVEALPRVLQKIPDVRCVIVGGRHDLEADYPQHLQDRIATLGLEQHVTMAGFQADVPRWMHAMDVVALPSAGEPFGITVVEAMAMGKPVIAGDSGGPTEIITSGVNGVLVAHEDVQALAGAILEYVERPDFSAHLGAAARERAGQFSGGRYAQELTRAVRELAGGRPVGRGERE